MNTAQLHTKHYHVYLLLTVTPTELNKSEGTLLDQFCLESTSMVIITFK